MRHPEPSVGTLLLFIELSYKMGIAVVAEGVETQQQKDILLELGCDFCQGYKYGRPMAAE